MKRITYLCAGHLALAMGMIGVVLPLLPTTPFVLLSAFFYSRSSRKLHQKLINNKLFGNLIKEWEKHGTIPLKAKCLSTLMMISMISYPLIYRPMSLSLKLAVIGCLCFSLTYIWSRPSLEGA